VEVTDAHANEAAESRARQGLPPHLSQSQADEIARIVGQDSRVSSTPRHVDNHTSRHVRRNVSEATP